MTAVMPPREATRVGAYHPPQVYAPATPVVGWDATEEEWLAARKHGLGGSDICAVLGFSGYHTPWDVWADKTGVRRWEDEGSAAAQLGTDLEPWLLTQAPRFVGAAVARTPHRTYAHPVFPWRRYSPDGLVEDGRLAEFKTAGLASGYGTPAGWAEGGVPLGYEFQTRWGLHVMDCPAAEVVALVAGLGLVHRTIERDMAIEHDMVAQVDDWYQRHIVGGEEPPFGAADGDSLGRLYARANGREIDLSDTDAIELWMAYRQARDREGAAKAAKDTAGAQLKALLGEHERGVVDGHIIATWSNKKGAVDWPRLVAEFAAAAKLPAPDPDLYRKPSTRSLSVKD